jgi:hypothetical protein
MRIFCLAVVLATSHTAAPSAVVFFMPDLNDSFWRGEDSGSPFCMHIDEQWNRELSTNNLTCHWGREHCGDPVHYDCSGTVEDSGKTEIFLGNGSRLDIQLKRANRYMDGNWVDTGLPKRAFELVRETNTPSHY